MTNQWSKTCLLPLAAMLMSWIGVASAAPTQGNPHEIGAQGGGGPGEYHETHELSFSGGPFERFTIFVRADANSASTAIGRGRFGRSGSVAVEIPLSDRDIARIPELQFVLVTDSLPHGLVLRLSSCDPDAQDVDPPIDTITQSCTDDEILKCAHSGPGVYCWHHQCIGMWIRRANPAGGFVRPI